MDTAETPAKKDQNNAGKTLKCIAIGASEIPRQLRNSGSQTQISGAKTKTNTAILGVTDQERELKCRMLLNLKFGDLDGNNRYVLDMMDNLFEPAECVLFYMEGPQKERVASLFRRVKLEYLRKVRLLTYEDIKFDCKLFTEEHFALTGENPLEHYNRRCDEMDLFVGLKRKFIYAVAFVFQELKNGQICLE